MNKKNFLIFKFFFLFSFFLFSYENKNLYQEFYAKTSIKRGKYLSCEMEKGKASIKLYPKKTSISLIKALERRVSKRGYTGEKISFEDFSSIIYYIAGIRRDGKRFHPSAGAFYPVKIFVLVKNVSGLNEGLFIYSEKSNSIAKLKCNKKAFNSIIENTYPRKVILEKSGFVIFYVCDFSKIKTKYLSRSIRYVFTELGTMVENGYLLAQSHSLGTVFLGAFYDDFINFTFKLSPPLKYVCGIQPFGKIR